MVLVLSQLYHEGGLNRCKVGWSDEFISFMSGNLLEI